MLAVTDMECDNLCCYACSGKHDKAWLLTIVHDYCGRLACCVQYCITECMLFTMSSD